MVKKGEPFYKLKKWERIIDFQLYLLGIIAILGIVTIIVENNGGISAMWKDILINLGCSVGSTIVMTVIIYFKFLKNIPDETQKAINNLLNARLGYETTNHNDLRNALSPDNAHLSKEHDNIITRVAVAEKTVVDLKSMIKEEHLEKKIRQESLNLSQSDIVASIEKIYTLKEQMMNLNMENITLVNENKLLKAELEEQKVINRTLSKHNANFSAPTPIHKNEKEKSTDYDSDYDIDF